MIASNSGTISQGNAPRRPVKLCNGLNAVFFQGLVFSLIFGWLLDRRFQSFTVLPAVGFSSNFGVVARVPGVTLSFQRVTQDRLAQLARTGMSPD